MHEVISKVDWNKREPFEMICTLPSTSCVTHLELPCNEDTDKDINVIDTTDITMTVNNPTYDDTARDDSENKVYENKVYENEVGTECIVNIDDTVRDDPENKVLTQMLNGILSDDIPSEEVADYLLSRFGVQLDEQAERHDKRVPYDVDAFATRLGTVPIRNSGRWTRCAYI
jgi:hypothetical protein